MGGGAACRCKQPAQAAHAGPRVPQVGCASAAFTAPPHLTSLTGCCTAERIWRWLEGSGPPFDNPPPSLGVPTVSKSNLAAASRRQGPKRGFFSCFNCFGGGGGTAR